MLQRSFGKWSSFEASIEVLKSVPCSNCAGGGEGRRWADARQGRKRRMVWVPPVGRSLHEMKFVTKSVNWTASIVRCFADSAGCSVGTLFRCSFLVWLCNIIACTLLCRMDKENVDILQEFVVYIIKSSVICKIQCRTERESHRNRVRSMRKLSFYLLRIRWMSAIDTLSCLCMGI